MKLFLLSIIPFLIFTVFKTKKSFHMLQQNYYDLDNRYFKWILTNISKVAFESDMLFVLITCTLFFDVGVTVGAFIILYGIIFINYKNKKVQTKKPLVITARIKRLSFTMFLIYFVFRNLNVKHIWDILIKGSAYLFVYIGLSALFKFRAFNVYKKIISEKIKRK